MIVTSVPAPFLLNATVVNVHDGDTINVVVDWGKRRYEGSAAHPQPIRLLGCNAIELASPGGAEAQANLAQLLPAGSPVVLSTVGDDKFSPRWDCGVAYVPLGGSGAVDLVTDLVVNGWAAPWNGTGPRPVPPWPRTPAVAQDRLGALSVAVREWRGLA